MQQQMDEAHRRIMDLESRLAKTQDELRDEQESVYQWKVACESARRETSVVMRRREQEAGRIRELIEESEALRIQIQQLQLANKRIPRMEAHLDISRRASRESHFESSRRLSVAEGEVQSLKSSLQERESQLKDAHAYKEAYPKLKQQYETVLRQLQQVKPKEEEALKLIRTQQTWINEAKGYIDALEDNSDQLDENCVAVLQEVINRDNDVERLKERLRELGDDVESFVPSDSLVPIESMGGPHYKVIRTNAVRKRASDWAKWIVSKVSKNGPATQAGSDAIDLSAGKPSDKEKTSPEQDSAYQMLEQEIKSLKEQALLQQEMIDAFRERSNPGD